ncbi:hypothetical protein D3C80_1537180 [compost metagenome]
MKRLGQNSVPGFDKRVFDYFTGVHAFRFAFTELFNVPVAEGVVIRGINDDDAFRNITQEFSQFSMLIKRYREDDDVHISYGLLALNRQRTHSSCQFCNRFRSS